MQTKLWNFKLWKIFDNLTNLPIIFRFIKDIYKSHMYKWNASIVIIKVEISIFLKLETSIEQFRKLKLKSFCYVKKNQSYRMPFLQYVIQHQHIDEDFLFSEALSWNLLPNWSSSDSDENYDWISNFKCSIL